MVLGVFAVMDHGQANPVLQQTIQAHNKIVEPAKTTIKLNNEDIRAILNGSSVDKDAEDVQKIISFAARAKKEGTQTFKIPEKVEESYGKDDGPINDVGQALRNAKFFLAYHDAQKNPGGRPMAPPTPGPVAAHSTVAVPAPQTPTSGARATAPRPGDGSFALAGPPVPPRHTGPNPPRMPTTSLAGNAGRAEGSTFTTPAPATRAAPQAGALATPQASGAQSPAGLLEELRKRQEERANKGAAKAAAASDAAEASALSRRFADVLGGRRGVLAADAAADFDDGNARFSEHYKHYKLREDESIGLADKQKKELELILERGEDALEQMTIEGREGLERILKRGKATNPDIRKDIITEYKKHNVKPKAAASGPLFDLRRIPQFDDDDSDSDSRSPRSGAGEGAERRPASRPTRAAPEAGAVRAVAAPVAAPVAATGTGAVRAEAEPVAAPEAAPASRPTGAVWRPQAPTTAPQSGPIELDAETQGKITKIKAKKGWGELDLLNYEYFKGLKPDDLKDEIKNRSVPIFTKEVNSGLRRNFKEFKAALQVLEERKASAPS